LTLLPYFFATVWAILLGILGAARHSTWCMSKISQMRTTENIK